MTESQYPPKQYYMVVDEKSTGPFTLEEVANHPALFPHTLVWKPGLDNWVAATTLPEFSMLWAAKEENHHPNPPHYNNYQQPQDPNLGQPEQNYGQPSYQEQQGYNRFANNPQYRSDHHYGPNQYNNRNYHQHYDPRYNGYQNGYRPAFRTNWLPWAIVATVVGFFTSCIGAIFGIIGIVQANKANTLYAQGLEPEADAANANAKTMTIIGLILAGIGLLCLFWFGSFFSNY